MRALAYRTLRLRPQHPLAKAEAFCVPVECFTIAGDVATVRFDTPLPPGSPPGTVIPVHEYKIAAAAFDVSGAVRWKRRTSGCGGLALATWVWRVEDLVVVVVDVDVQWFSTGKR